MIGFMVFASFIPLFANNAWLRFNSFVFFIPQFLLLSLFILNKAKYFHTIFLPSNIMFFYLGISFSIGSIFVPLDIGFLTKSFSHDYHKIENFPFIIFFWMQVFNVTALISILTMRNEIIYRNISYKKKKYRSLLVVLLSMLMLIIISGFDFFFVFGTQLALLLVALIHSKNVNAQCMLLVALSGLIVFVSFNSHNKRELLMAIMLVIIYFGLIYKFKLKFNLKYILVYCLMVLIFVLLILVSSVIRGYGGFDGGDVITAAKFIPIYLTSENFFHSLMDNFEVSHTFPVSVLSIDYILSGRLEMQAGTTLLKPLFLFTPREILAFKPDSFIHIFTATQNPAIYSLGGSYPVPFPSELFANFHLISLFILIVFLYFFNKIYFFIFIGNQEGIKFRISILFTVLLFILIRGGGADLLFIHFLSTLPILLLFGKYKKCCLKI